MVTDFTDVMTRESNLHIELCQELDSKLEDDRFYIWITLQLHEHGHEQLTALAELTEEIATWLRCLDPDHLDQPYPTRVFDDPAADVIITAIPRRSTSDTGHSRQIVANPLPVIFEI